MLTFLSSFSKGFQTVGPSAEDILRMIAEKYLKSINPSSPEELNGFLRYLQQVREVLIVDTEEGSLIIITECRSLEILENLWDDYCSGHLLEITQKCLVTVDILKALDLIEMKLTMTIDEEEYKACREYLLKRPGMNENSPSQVLRQLGVT